ncbi:MAG: sulfurtransferase TusA family protein [Fibrobacteria bacterium]|nr:sulfurtransferase TusA family protein [Fibrobacteria bacterium]
MEQIDVSGISCPLNYAKIKVKLSQIYPGKQLQALIDNEKALDSISTSLTLDSHKLISISPKRDGKYLIIVEK